MNALFAPQGMVFSDKIISDSDCPTFPNPGTGSAEFVAVSTFCTIADENADIFYDYLLNISDLPTFNTVLDFYLLPIIEGNPSCCPSTNRRAMMQMFNVHKTILVYPIDARDNQPLKQYPMGYQGIFTNVPAVTGDIAILLVTIFSSICVTGCVCWFCHLEFMYSENPQSNEYHDKIALPQKKS